MRLAYTIAIAGLFSITACTEPNPAFGGPGSVLDSGSPGQDGRLPDDDLWYPPPLTDSGQICSPGSFTGCASDTHLLKCNPAGTGTITITCAPFLCNAAAGRCNQCDPKRPPTCVNNSVQSCSSDGLLVLTSCPDGCDEGKCTKPCTKQTYWLDADGDGFGDPQQQTLACEQPPGHVTNDKDCYDQDKAAKPGQQGWFTAPMQGYSVGDSGAFDFDCSGTTEQYRTDQHSGCAFKNNQCEGTGWSNSVPECSKWGWWVECKKTSMGRVPCVPGYSQKVQSCH